MGATGPKAGRPGVDPAGAVPGPVGSGKPGAGACTPSAALR
ncbi:hypothetical protein ABT403_26000 [Streptomyces sp. NPDC000075]